MESSAGPSWSERSMLGSLLLLAALLPVAWSSSAASTYFTAKFVLLGLVFIVLMALLALEALWSRRLHLPAGAHLAMTAFLLWCLISTLASTSRGVSFIGRGNYGEGLLSLVAYGVLAYSASSLVWDTERRRRLSLAFGVASVFLVAVSLLQLAGKDSFLLSLGLAGMGARGKITGLFGNPVFLGGFIVIALPLLAASALASKTKRMTMAGAALCLALAFVSLATLTRAGWLGLVAALVVTALFGYRELAARRRRVTGAAAAALLLIAVTVPTFATAAGGSLSDRIGSLFKTPEGSSVMRFQQWKVAMRMVSDKPLLGWGPSEYRLGFDEYATKAQITAEPATSNDAHNLFAHAAATTGIPGLALLAATIGLFVLGGVKTVRRLAGDERLFAAAVLGALAGYLVWVQFEPSTVGVTPLFWLLAGTLVPTKTHVLAQEALEKEKAFAVSLGIVLTAAFLAVMPIRYLLADQSELTGLIASSPVPLETALALNGLNPEYYFNLAKAYRREGEMTRRLEPIDQAKDVLARAERLGPEFEVYLQLGKAHLSAAQLSGEKAEYESAIALLRRALAMRPLSAIARLNLGFAHLLIKDYKSAERYLREASKLPPPDTQTFLLLGRAYEGLNRTGDAREAYRQALKVDPKNAEAQRSLGELVE